MATPYPAPTSALQVGSYFVQQYYQILQEHPDYVHQFYSDASIMVRVDGDSSETASGMLQIHAVVTSLNFTAIEIKTINSLESWSGGVVLVVSGSVKSKDFIGWRKFVQTFFLAPQEKGYFVLNDIFHFVNEEVMHHNSAPIALENKHDSCPATSNPGLEIPVSDYTSAVETREFISSVRIDGDDQVDEYSIQEHQQNEYGLQEEYQQHEYALQDQYQQNEYSLQEQYQQHEYTLQEQYQQHEPDAEIVQEEAPVDKQSDLLPNAVEPAQEPSSHVEESLGDLPKLSYASILRTSKGKSAPSITTKPSSPKIIQFSSERNHISPPPVQQSNPELSSVQDHNVEVGDEGFLQEEEGESKSVYVRNLPPTITTLDILHEFENFGRVSSDGVFIKNRKEFGVCYAFVEFEDFHGVQNAIKESPIQLAGRQVYIEGRRANSSSSAPRRGRGRGRGRGSYQNEGQRGRLDTRLSGRGSNQDAGDYKMKGNGFRGS